MNKPIIKLNVNLSDGSKHELSCNSDLSVDKLKELIQMSLPSHPEASCQILFYKGNQLNNTDKLSSFLLLSDTVHAIQLLLNGPEATLNSQDPSSSIRHRHPTSSIENNPWMQWQQNPMFSYYSTFSYGQQQPSTAEQYTVMWKQYQQQLNNYMHYYNTQTSTTQAQSSHPHGVANEPPAEPNQAPAAAPPGPRANIPDANPPMNAQGGFAAVDNDDFMPRDWLDILFTVFRYSFFLSIIYFYSSFWRFLLVAGFFLIIYIYQSGVFNAQRRPPHPDEIERRENDGAEAPNPTDDNNNNNNAEENDENSVEEQAPPPPSIFTTAWCFITTFFSSLIPQPPPVV